MMNVLELDIPLLVIGLIILIWGRFTKPASLFQVMCQFVGTFWAQYSFGANLSLGRLVPFLALTTRVDRSVRHCRLFVPFVVYAVLSCVVFSSFWSIPEGVDPIYGKYRAWVQLAVFLSVVLSTRALAHVLVAKKVPYLLWVALSCAVTIHGLASIYHYVAWEVGLPIIGISRPHEQTIIADEPDSAAFETEEGMVVPRPGGLAGEPKTAAALFGIFIVASSLSGIPRGVSKAQRALGLAAITLAIVGFTMAFSTSAIVGVLLAYIILIPLLGKRIGLASFAICALVSIAVVILWDSFLAENTGRLADLLWTRIIGRMEDQLDFPVEAALWALYERSFILLFGTGLGGASFIVMEWLGISYDYSFTPNIGFLSLILETGLVGVLCLVLPFAVLTLKCGKQVRFSSRTRDAALAWEAQFLLSIAVAAMSIMMAGSGIAMGYVLAIGSICACAQVLRLASPLDIVKR